MFGQALASSQDLLMEHVSLFGTNKPVNFEALRVKAVAEKQPLRNIWEREMHVPERRQEIAAKAQAELDAKRAAELAAAKQEGIELGMSRSINPMTRPAEAGSSRFGTTFSQRDTTAGKPWESPAARDSSRLQKVVSTLAKAGIA